MVSGLSSKVILVTGANGFIGANLVRYLIKSGCHPHITVRKHSNLWRIKTVLSKIRLHHVDLVNKDGVEKTISKIKPQIIYHCATYGGYPYQREFDKIVQTNIIGTINLLEACIKFKFDCFVNSGSSSEYGVKQEPMREADSIEPLSAYGAAKASATLFCAAIGKKERLPIVTLRLFSPYGYYEEPIRLIPEVINACLNKRIPRLSSPDSVRDFVFIEDAVEAYIKAVQNNDKVGGEIFNIAGGRQCSVAQVVDKIMELIPYEVQPLWGSLSNPRIEPCCWEADIQKAARLLNWKPAHTLDEGLRKTIDWFKKKRKLYDDKN